MDLENSADCSKRETVAGRLERHPVLKTRKERTLDVVENAGGYLRRTDDAKRSAIEELRLIGLEIMQDWGGQDGRRSSA